VLHWSRVLGAATMANLTLTIDDEVLRRARIRALEQGTSVNAIVRAHLERFAQDDGEALALQELRTLARESTASSGEGGRMWTRDDLHDR
jgi:plasmid stability protein